MRYIDEFRVPETARGLARMIRDTGVEATLMEVCGTHTMAISRAGLREMLSPALNLVSGPGCPVCVTTDREIDTAVAISGLPDVVLATFGDMMKVPGSGGSLEQASTEGADIRVVYSPLDALGIAREETEMRVVFLGVGFETTAPAVAATIQQARREGLVNFFLLSFHKLVPPALRALAGAEDFQVDGFLLPGHVSTIIGLNAYSFLVEEFQLPAVIAGFETNDILQAAFKLVKMLEEGKPAVENEYSRAVRKEGNEKALGIMNEVFEPVDSWWRGLFKIESSGLSLRDRYSSFDAARWDVELPKPAGDRGCRCGDVLCGRIRPTECALFAGACTPDSPVGPCMVSSEGTCASYYLYQRNGG